MQRYYDTILDTNGNPADGVQVLVTDSNTGASVTLYSANEDALDPTTTISNPIVTGATGLVAFAVPNGVYNVSVSGSNIVAQSKRWLAIEDVVAATATSVAFTPYSTVTSTNVQDALEEVIDDVNAVVGGSNTQIQFNNNGVLDGDSNLTFVSGTGMKLGQPITMADVSTPSNPATGYLGLYSNSFGGKSTPSWVDSFGTISVPQGMLARAQCSYIIPPGNSSGVSGSLNFQGTATVGTVTARNVASTSYYTRQRRVGWVSSAVAGNLAGFYQSTNPQITTGTGSGAGGFLCLIRFGCADAATVAGARSFVGVSSSTAAPTNVEPSSLTNAIGVAQLSSSSNLHVVYGGSSAQTPIDLGSGFPADTLSTDWYELIIHAPAFSEDVYLQLIRLSSGTMSQVVKLTNTTPGTTLPASTTFLCPRLWRCNNATALSVGIDYGCVYFEM